MIVFRLANKKYAEDISGIGAEITGGRWNFKGTRVLYTADSRALCLAEIAVHTPIGLMPKDYFLITIEIPDSTTIHKLETESLPLNWRKFPYPSETQKIGEKFIINKTGLAIKVPSAVVQGDYNIIINPLHPDFEMVSVIKKEKFSFDERLFK